MLCLRACPQGHFRLVNHQIIRIRTAFAIGTILNRAVIVPQLWCGLDRWWAPHTGAWPPRSRTPLLAGRARRLCHAVPASLSRGPRWGQLWQQQQQQQRLALPEESHTRGPLETQTPRCTSRAAGVIPGSNFELPFPCPMDHVFDLEGGLGRDLPADTYGPPIQFKEWSFLNNSKVNLDLKQTLPCCD